MYSRKRGFDDALQAMYSRKKGFDGDMIRALCRYETQAQAVEHHTHT